MNSSQVSYNGTPDNSFYIVAFQTLESKNYLMLGLSFIYIITLMGNFILLTTVFMNPSLHSPKYIAVCNLAMVDISINSVIIPQMVPVFVFNLSRVPFEMCFSQMFFLHFFGDLESFSLAVLAYDRLIAICLPLRYPSINTNQGMCFIVAAVWLLVFFLDAYPVGLASKLPYCGSRVVRSCCCEHGPVYILACTDISFNRRLALTKTMIVLLTPLIFIIFSYIVVVATVLKIASAEKSRKAFHTCFTHLLLVLTYYLPVILAYLLGSQHLALSPDQLIAVLTVSVTMPPMLNPIIYSLKTEEVRVRIMKGLGLQKIHPELRSKRSTVE
ncbi:Main Olfactory Receptor-like [Scleropages formosus]|uniref:Main Olfactory Receptor-like n=1 Tax=Scleropages formosus TaxID=113540 RepID=A0A0P7TZL6_SCLFO|nr:Main Olfactory Receptor-like [Scleropages formosus]